MYFFTGIRYLLGAIIPSLILYSFASVFAIIIGKRSRRFYRDNKGKAFVECLLVIYLFTIFNITGILFSEYHLEWFLRGISSLTAAPPFAGASAEMVFLNTLLFVPYGGLLALYLREISRKKLLLIVAAVPAMIEFLQLFVGRMFEWDDLIANVCGTLFGYFFVKGILAYRHRGKKALVKTGALILCGVVYTAGLLWITENTAPEEEYFHEIGSEEEELKQIEEISVLKNGERYALDKEYREECYQRLGDDITNMSVSYREEKSPQSIEEISASGETYVRISYTAPQSFTFTNNRERKMENVTRILYHLESGDLYYETEGDGVCYHWLLEDELFEKNELLNDLFIEGTGIDKARRVLYH